MKNEDKAKEIYENYRNETVYFAAMKMAQWKDEQLKKFLLTFISIPYDGGHGEDGSPLAEDYIKWMEDREKVVDEILEKYKNFE